VRNVPTVKSKLVMPQLSSYIMLENLDIIGKSIPKQQVIVVSAPAGYGKTTLIVASLKKYAENSRICWYRLEEEDRDLIMFYAHLIETLFSWRENGSEGILDNLTAYGDVQSQYTYINAAICQELWNFSSMETSPRTFLVLEDFHNIKDSAEICYFLSYLINNLPANLSVIVSSRSKPEFITVKQKFENEIMEINQEDLCFSEKDLIKYTAQTYQTKPDKELMRKIILLTEGWPAGIVLICQLFYRLDPLERTNYLEKIPEKAYLFDYFAVEVFKKLDVSLMLFLVKMAILKDFTQSQAALFFDSTQVEHYLSQCEAYCLFIQKSGSDVMTYRFHGLFREAILRNQSRYLTPEEIKDCHLKAAGYYLENKVMVRALDHYIESGKIEEATDLIIRESANLGPFEAMDSLRLWFKHLPADLVEQNGSLLYIKSYIYQKGETEGLDLLQKALPLLQKSNDLIMQVKVWHSIVYFYVFRNDKRNIVGALQQILTLLKDMSNPDLEGLITVTDLQKAFWQEKLSKGMILSQRALSFDLIPDFRWVALINSSQLYYLLGDLDKAGELIKETLAMELVQRTEMLQGFSHMFLAAVYQMKNDGLDCRKMIDKTIEIGNKYNSLLLLGMGKRLAGIESYLSQDKEKACQLLSASSEHFLRLGNIPMCLLNEIQQSAWMSDQGDPQELLVKAKKALSELRSLKPGQCIFEVSQSLTAVLAREAGDYQFAEKNLLQAAESSKKKKARQVLCGVYFNLAKLYSDTGDSDQKEDYLKQALSIASESGYTMFWDLHIPTITEMAIYGIKNNICPEYASVLLERYFGENVAQTNFPAEIKVTLFGKFKLEVNGEEIPVTSWKTRKIEGILKYLILHRNKTTSKETLMELFWPSSNKKAASSSLRVALYELRKVLSQYNIPVKEKESLVQENIYGLEVKTGDTMYVDIDEFLTLYENSQKLSLAPKSIDKEITLLEKMVHIYKGNLLENDQYEDWTYFEREELKSIFLKAASSLVSAYQKRKEPQEAQKVLLIILAHDPYNEEACFSLLQMYMATKQRARALMAYDNFKKRLQKDLGIEPDPKLAIMLEGL